MTARFKIKKLNVFTEEVNQKLISEEYNPNQPQISDHPYRILVI